MTTSILRVLDAHHVVDDAALRRYLRAPNNAVRVDAAKQELARRGWRKVEGGWVPEGETGVSTLKDACDQALDESVGDGMPEGKLTWVWGENG